MELSVALLPASIGSWFADTAFNGSLVLAIPVALVAGGVSFFSPCVLPLLPGYLSYVTGLSAADIGADGRTGFRSRMVVGTLLFIAGFSFVFVSVSAAIGRVGYLFLAYSETITRALGVLTIIVGLVFAGVLPWLQRDLRLHAVPAVGLTAAPLLGVLFGVGWTPCIGPTLAAVLTLSYNEASASRGALLATAYCLGLGLPFLVAAVAYRRTLTAIGWVRRHQVWVMRLGGGLLVLVGVLLLTDAWDYLIAWTQTKAGGFETAV